MRYEVILRYGINERGHEYRFAETRRERGAIAERDRMVETTLDNMRDHAHDGRVVQGPLATDPNAVVCVLMDKHGSCTFRVVTYRPVAPVNDGLEDALLASILALGAGTL